MPKDRQKAEKKPGHIAVVSIDGTQILHMGSNSAQRNSTDMQRTSANTSAEHS